jgi:hypothetical protein
VVARRREARSTKPLPRRANQRQTDEDNRICGAGSLSQPNVPSVDRKSDPRNFVFYEYRLTRRAKQWHTAIVADPKAEWANRHTRRTKSQPSGPNERAILIPR